MLFCSLNNKNNLLRKSFYILTSTKTINAVRIIFPYYPESCNLRRAVKAEILAISVKLYYVEKPSNIIQVSYDNNDYAEFTPICRPLGNLSRF